MYICIPCARKYSKKHRDKQTPEQRARRNYTTRRNRLSRTYGITTEQYEALLSAQDGVCAICKENGEDRGAKSLAVDHCHTTGRVRGLLCRRCNAGLGQFKDCPEGVERALAYLRRHYG
jgi:hypothetical protein